MPGGAIDPLARRLAAGDRAELGGQAEGVEAEGEQDVLTTGAAVARVGVADRVAAHVSDVDVARGEGGRGLDVEVRLILVQGRRAEGGALAPVSLPTRLHGMWLIAVSAALGHTFEHSQGPKRGSRDCYAQTRLAATPEKAPAALRRTPFGPALSGVFSSAATARM